jgi:hypothetical protein
VDYRVVTLVATIVVTLVATLVYTLVVALVITTDGLLRRPLDQLLDFGQKIDPREIALSWILNRLAFCTPTMAKK